MTAIAQALNAALIEFIWQGLLAAFLLWAALFALRNRSARARYLASCAALAAMAVLPIVTACLLYTAPTAPQTSLAWIAAAPQLMRAAIPSQSHQSFSWTAWLSRWALPVWSLGVLLFSLRLVWASRQISGLRRQAQPADAGLRATIKALQQRMRLARPVHVVISAASDCPSVAGWIKPVMLLPAATIAGLTPQQLEAVLAHELAHILRYDYVVNMFQSIVETLLFYHPAVWWASARIRHERELCCDDLAVESCGDALCYARALTRLERLRTATPALALSSAGGSLLYRIQRLAGETGWQRGPSKLPGVVALALGLACFALNMQWARGQQQDAANPAAAATPAMPNEPGVQIDLDGAVLNHREEVEYPGPAMEKGIQGTVVVEATLDASGLVSDARVLSGPQELRKAALQSVLEWHFAPGTTGPTHQVRMMFQLPSEDDAAKLHAEQRSRKAEARALMGEKRQRDAVNVLMQKQLAENMERQARDQQTRKLEALEAQAEAKRLVEQLPNMKIKRDLMSAELAQSLAEQDLENQGRWTAQEKEKSEAIESKLEALRSQAAAQAGSDSALSAARSSQMVALEKRLAELHARFGDFHFDAMVAGRTLKAIDVQGLTPAAREELLAKLPVHVGDTLAEDSMDKIEAAARQFDQHLNISVISHDGQVELHIAVTGSNNVLEPPQ